MPGYTITMNEFTHSFHRCVIAGRTADKDLDDEIDDGSIPKEVYNHAMTLQQDKRCGPIRWLDYKHYVQVMSHIYYEEGVTALVLTTIIFPPGAIFSLNWKASDFDDFWSRCKILVPNHVDRDAERYAANTDIIPLLLAAEANMNPSRRVYPAARLAPPEQPKVSRRKSISEKVKRMVNKH